MQCRCSVPPVELSRRGTFSGVPSTFDLKLRQTRQTCNWYNLPSFYISLIYKMGQFSLGHHSILKSEPTEFIDVRLSNTYANL